jgi:hypothetical protein
VYKRNISAVKRVEFVSDRTSYITLSDQWCGIIVLNVHAPIGDKIDDAKNNSSRKWNIYLINSLNITQKFWYEISITKWVQIKLLGIISVGFNITDQLLISFIAFIRYWREIGVQ